MNCITFVGEILELIGVVVTLWIMCWRCGGPRLDQSRIRLNAYRACAIIAFICLTRSGVVATAYVMHGPRFD